MRVRRPGPIEGGIQTISDDRGTLMMTYPSFNQSMAEDSS